MSQFAHISDPESWFQLPKKWTDTDGALTDPGRQIHIPPQWADSLEGLARLAQLGLYPCRRGPLPEGVYTYAAATLIDGEIVRQAGLEDLQQWKTQKTAEAEAERDRRVEQITGPNSAKITAQTMAIVLINKRQKGEALTAEEEGLQAVLEGMGAMSQAHTAALEQIEAEIDALNAIAPFDVTDPIKWP